MHVDLPPHADVNDADSGYDDPTHGVYNTDEMPRFRLLVWNGGRDYKHFDRLCVLEEEWEAWKEKREPLQGRIVEVAWDPERNDGDGGWKPLRFRDDKTDGNFRDVVESIKESIRDAVEKNKVSDSASLQCKLINSSLSVRARLNKSGMIEIHVDNATIGDMYKRCRLVESFDDSWPLSYRHLV